MSHIGNMENLEHVLLFPVFSKFVYTPVSTHQFQQIHCHKTNYLCHLDLFFEEVCFPTPVLRSCRHGISVLLISPVRQQDLDKMGPGSLGRPAELQRRCGPGPWGRKKVRKEAAVQVCVFAFIWCQMC